MHWKQSRRLMFPAVDEGRLTYDFCIWNAPILCRQAHCSTRAQAKNWTTIPYAKNWLLFLPHLWGSGTSIVGLVDSSRVHDCRLTASAPPWTNPFSQLRHSLTSCERDNVATRTKTVRENKRYVHALRALRSFLKLQKCFNILRLKQLGVTVLEVLLAANFIQKTKQ